MIKGGQNLSDKESNKAIHKMQHQAEKVGNLPCYIMTDEKYGERKRDTTVAIKALRENDIKSILNFTGIIRPETTIPGCIFAVNVKIDSTAPIPRSYEHYSSDVEDDEEIIDYSDSDEDDVDSDNDNDDDNYEMEEIEKLANVNNAGYDGQFVRSYGTCVLELMSRTIVQAVAFLNRKKLLSFWARLGSSGTAGEMGYAI
jgi:hypothetical protein